MTRPSSRYVDRRAEIARRRRDIDDLVLLAQECQDPETQRALVSLTIVRLSGFVESSVRLMIQGYAEEHSSHRILKFVIGQSQRLPSATAENLIKTVGQLDPDWTSELKDFLAQEERKQDLNNLIGARHLVAHGEDQSLTIKTLWRYQALVDALVSMMQKQFLPRL